MALTTGSFVPETRKGGGGGGAAAHGGANGNMHGSDNSASVNESGPTTTGPAENGPSSHPVTGTALPKGTGAGKGSIQRGGRAGK